MADTATIHATYARRARALALTSDAPQTRARSTPLVIAKTDNRNAAAPARRCAVSTPNARASRRPRRAHRGGGRVRAEVRAERLRDASHQRSRRPARCVRSRSARRRRYAPPRRTERRARPPIPSPRRVQARRLNHRPSARNSTRARAPRRRSAPGARDEAHVHTPRGRGTPHARVREPAVREGDASFLVPQRSRARRLPRRARRGPRRALEQRDRARRRRQTAFAASDLVVRNARLGRSRWCLEHHMCCHVRGVPHEPRVGFFERRAVALHLPTLPRGVRSRRVSARTPRTRRANTSPSSPPRSGSPQSACASHPVCTPPWRSPRARARRGPGRARSTAPRRRRPEPPTPTRVDARSRGSSRRGPTSGGRCWSAVQWTSP